MLTKKFGPHDSPPENLVSEKHRQALRPWRFGKELPLVSIVIPTYNRARWLGESVESALAQDYPRLEVLVVDDGSTDKTSEIIKGFTDPRLRYLKKEHTGAPATRNCGILQAKGDFILWLDSDDILLPHTVTREIEVLSKFPEAGLVYGDKINIDGEGRETGHRGRTVDYWDIDPLSDMIWRAPGHGGSMVRRSVYEKYGLFDERFVRAQDVEFWSRIAREVRFKHAGCFVLWRRIHDSQMSGDMRRKDLDTSYEMEIVERLVARYPLRRLFPAFFRDGAVLGECRAYLALAQIAVHWKNANRAHFYFREAAARFRTVGHRGRRAIAKELDAFLHISYLAASPYFLAEAIAAARSFPWSLASWRRLAMIAVPSSLRLPLCKFKERMFERERCRGNPVHP